MFVKLSRIFRFKLVKEILQKGFHFSSQLVKDIFWLQDVDSRGVVDISVNPKRHGASINLACTHVPRIHVNRDSDFCWLLYYKIKSLD